MIEALKPRAFLDLLHETVAEWAQDKAPRLGAALAYYTIFSIAPLVFIIMAIVGALFGQEAGRNRLIAQAYDLVGAAGADLVQGLLDNTPAPSDNWLITAAGLITLLLGSLGAFSQLQDALDTIWEVTPAPGSTVARLVEKRLISFVMVVGVGFFLILSLVVNTVLTGLSDFLKFVVPAYGLLLNLVNIVVPVILFTLLFALIFKYVPDAEVAWGDVWLGAALISVLFTIGKALIAFYLGSIRPGSAYGTAGSLVAVLVWIYFSAQILFFGAEFTHVYMKRYGSRRAPPEPGAVPVTEEARAHQGIPRVEQVEAAAEEARRAGVAPALVQTDEDGQAVPALGRGRARYLIGALTFILGIVTGIIVKPKDRSQFMRQK